MTPHTSVLSTPKSLNESPSEKEGKSCHPRPNIPKPKCLNESPSEKEGKSERMPRGFRQIAPPQ